MLLHGVGSTGDILEDLNISNAQATHESDRQRIMSDIQSDMGDVLQLNLRLKDAIIASAQEQARAAVQGVEGCWERLEQGGSGPPGVQVLAGVRAAEKGVAAAGGGERPVTSHRAEGGSGTVALQHDLAGGGDGGCDRLLWVADKCVSGGNVSLSGGDARGAEAMYLMAYQLRQHVWGREHPDTLDASCDLGQAASALGRYVVQH